MSFAPKKTNKKVFTDEYQEEQPAIKRRPSPKIDIPDSNLKTQKSINGNITSGVPSTKVETDSLRRKIEIDLHQYNNFNINKNDYNTNLATIDSFKRKKIYEEYDLPLKTKKNVNNLKYHSARKKLNNNKEPSKTFDTFDEELIQKRAQSAKNNYNLNYYYNRNYVSPYKFSAKKNNKNSFKLFNIEEYYFDPSRYEEIYKLKLAEKMDEYLNLQVEVNELTKKHEQLMNLTQENYFLKSNVKKNLDSNDEKNKKKNKKKELFNKKPFKAINICEKKILNEMTKELIYPQVRTNEEIYNGMANKIVYRSLYLPKNNNCPTCAYLLSLGKSTDNCPKLHFLFDKPIKNSNNSVKLKNN